MKCRLNIIENTTCFYEHEKREISCNRKKCPHWIQREESYNCAIICSQNGPYTLDQIGEIYNLSKMRICQMEKYIINKLKKRLKI